MLGYLQLLRQNPNFTRLWLARVVSLLGDWFSTIVLAAVIRDLTSGSGAEGLAISGLFLAQVLPPLIFSPLGGVLTDRFDRKKLIIITDVLRAVAVLGILVAFALQSLALIYLLRIFQFALSALFEPAHSALLPNLVRQQDLVRANTLSSITWSVMLAIGSLAGGIVGTLFGAEFAIVIDAGTFLLSALLVLGIRTTSAAHLTTVSDEEVSHQQSGSFREGLTYVTHNPQLIPVLLVKFGGTLGNVDTLMTFYATQIFVLGAGGELSLGILYSAFGFGALMGPVIANRFHDGEIKSLQRTIIFGFALLVLGWIVLGWAPTLLFAGFALIVRSMGTSINWVYSTTIIQKSVPDAFLGRAFSLDLAGYYFASVLSTIIHGALIDIFSSSAANSGLPTLLQISGVYGDVIAQTLRNDGIRQIVFYTGAVSVIPCILWLLVLPKLQRRTASAAQQQITICLVGD